MWMCEKNKRAHTHTQTYLSRVDECYTCSNECVVSVLYLVYASQAREQTHGIKASKQAMLHPHNYYC